MLAQLAQTKDDLQYQPTVYYNAVSAIYTCSHCLLMRADCLKGLLSPHLPRMNLPFQSPLTPVLA
jgi:hypothetical protein